MAQDPTTRAEAEKRSHERVPFEGEIEVELDGGEPLRASAVNLSRDGACFFAARSPRVGASLRLRFRVGEQAFRLSASVRHATRVVSEIADVEQTTGYIVGVQFASLSSSDLASLDRAVAELRALDAE